MEPLTILPTFSVGNMDFKPKIYCDVQWLYRLKKVLKVVHQIIRIIVYIFMKLLKNVKKKVTYITNFDFV